MTLRKAVILFIIFYLFNASNLFGEENYYNLFLDNYKNKDYKKALLNIEKAYREKNEDANIIYWYGILLYMNEKFSESVNILEKLPVEYKTYPTQWYISESYKKLNDFETALIVAEAAIPLIDDDSEDKRHLYNSFFEVLKKEKKYEKLKKYLDENYRDIEKYYENKNSEWFDWIKYLITSAFTDYSKELAEKEDARSYEYLEFAAEYFSKGLGVNAQYIQLDSAGVVYFKKKLYNEAIAHLSLIPENHRPLIKAYYLAESYKNIDKKEEAIETVLPVLTIDEEKPYWKIYIYSVLFQLLKDADGEDKIIELEPDYFSYQKNVKSDMFPYINHLLAKYFFEKFENYGVDNNKIKMEEFYNLGLKYYKTDLQKYRDYIQKEEIDFLYGVFSYYRENESKISSAYKHKILVIIFNELDSHWLEKNGTKRYSHNFHQDELIEKYDKALAFFSKEIFFLTKGKILPVYEFRKVDSKVTEIEYRLFEGEIKVEAIDVYQPVLATVTPHIGELIFENRNNYDTFIYVTPNEDTYVYGTGGKSGLNFIPYVLTGKLRGYIMMGSSVMTSHRGLLHEFFHNVEGAYREDYNFIAHTYKESYKKIWPKWYKGEGELFYYKYAFENIVSKDNFALLRFRDITNDTGDTEFFTKNEYFKKHSIEDLKKADKYKNQAWDYYKENKYDKSLDAFLLSYELYKYDEKVTEMIGWYYFKKEDYKPALKFYLESLGLSEKQNILSMVAYLYEKNGNIEEAIKSYKSAYEKYGVANDLYNLSRLLYSTEDYVGAVNYFVEYLEKFKQEDLAIYSLNLLSWILVNKSKDYEKTISVVGKYFDILIDKKSDVKKNIAFNMALAYGESGNIKEALIWLEKALKLGYNKNDTYVFYFNKYSKK